MGRQGTDVLMWQGGPCWQSPDENGNQAGSTKVSARSRGLVWVSSSLHVNPPCKWIKIQMANVSSTSIKFIIHPKGFLHENLLFLVQYDFVPSE